MIGSTGLCLKDGMPCANCHKSVVINITLTRLILLMMSTQTWLSLGYLIVVECAPPDTLIQYLQKFIIFSLLGHVQNISIRLNEL